MLLLDKTKCYRSMLYGMVTDCLNRPLLEESMYERFETIDWSIEVRLLLCPKNLEPKSKSVGRKSTRGIGIRGF